MTDAESLSLARERVERLRAHLAHATGGPVRLVETHISWVLLGGELAWKLKKPVRLPFLDFRTLAARRQYSHEELRVNGRLAPALYLDVLDVVETPAGPRLGGAGRVVDVALRMRRFPDGALWSERLIRGDLGESEIDALAAVLGGFHASLAGTPPDAAYGSANQHERVMDGLLSALPAHDPASAQIARWLRAEFARLRDHFERRRDAGKIREGHGDLHLSNIVQIGSRSTPFDAIEFDPSLRWIDPVADVAFTVMDLLAYGAASLGWRLLHGWLEWTGDFDALPALRFHLVCRALVRAQVCGLREREGSRDDAAVDAAAYRALALVLANSAAGWLTITHGLPGSGKTTAARRLAQANGAVLVRSDIERKRLFGLGPLERSDASHGIYDASTSARTYTRLAEVARSSLAAGWPAVVDAAFLRRAERDAFSRLAEQAGVPFTILECVAPPAVLRDRVRARLASGGDASEADPTVVDRLAAVAEPLDDDERRYATLVSA